MPIKDALLRELVLWATGVQSQSWSTHVEVVLPGTSKLGYLCSGVSQLSSALDLGLFPEAINFSVFSPHPVRGTSLPQVFEKAGMTERRGNSGRVCIVELPKLNGNLGLLPARPLYADH